MKSVSKTKRLWISGMTCAGCQNKIAQKLSNTAGIQKAAVSYPAGAATVTYDTDLITLKDIIKIIHKLGYKAADTQPPASKSRVAGMLLMILALSVLVQRFGIGGLANAFPLAEAGTAYGMLFVIGLITSLHCVAMCGGINLSQCIPQDFENTKGGRYAALLPSFLYNFGRVASYTVVGGIVGGLGSVIRPPGGLGGIVQLIAGVFMIIMGVNMLGIFPWLGRLNPRIPKRFAGRLATRRSHSKSPLYVGLLNGLMPCGPLQAMQLYALSTGSPWRGALSMLLFSLGTVPLMFGLGALSSVLSKKFTRQAMTAGAVLVVVLGVSMFSNGWSLTGVPLPAAVSPGEASPRATDARAEPENSVQIIRSTLSGGRYPAITVQADRAVKWIINAPQGSINGCNNRILIPEFGIEYQFKTGENIIEFTPKKPGKFLYSCWMGMLRSTITVSEGAQESGS